MRNRFSRPHDQPTLWTDSAPRLWAAWLVLTVGGFALLAWWRS